MLEVLGVTKSFPTSHSARGRSGRVSTEHVAQTVVNEVSFTVGSGQVFGLLGESGAGKSTLAMIIAGLLEPDRGDVVLDGVSIPQDLREQGGRYARSRLRMLFQHPGSALHPSMTIEANLMQVLRKFHPDESEMWSKQVVLALDEVGLARTYLGKYAHELSGGEKRRVGICRALLTSPAMIVADEPTAGLDLSVQTQVIGLFLQLKADRNMSMILITHDLFVASACCDTIGVMRSGRLVDLGRYEELSDPARKRDPFTQELFSANYAISLGKNE